MLIKKKQVIKIPVTSPRTKIDVRQFGIAKYVVVRRLSNSTKRLPRRIRVQYVA